MVARPFFMTLPGYPGRMDEKEILNDFKLGRKDLVAFDYDDLLEKAEHVETKKISSVLEKLNSHKQSILENKQSSELFFDEER